MKQKFRCEMEGCESILRNRDTYRTHVKRVHKSLPPDEMKKFIENISKAQPIYEDNKDQLDDVGSEEEKPRKKKISKKLK